MNLKRFEALGLIEKARPNSRQIALNLHRARRDLITASATLKIDEEWAYTIAYHAMLRAARALLLSSGYRPKGKDQHKTAVEICAEILGEEYLHLTTRFNRMRMKRHDFIYEPGRPIPKTEAAESLKTAERLVEEIGRRIRLQSSNNS